MSSYIYNLAHFDWGTANREPLIRKSWRERLHAYIGGVLPNRPMMLTAWLRDPPAIDPATAMPALGLSEAEARDMAAYLYRLR